MNLRAAAGAALCGALVAAVAGAAAAAAPTDYDASFGTGGVASVPPSSTTLSFAQRLAIDSSGNIVAAGVIADLTANAPSFDLDVARFTSAGALDSTFGTSGQARTPIGAGLTVTGIAITTGGILVTATDPATPKSWIVRYTSAGALDPTFGTNGQATTGNLITALATDAAGDALLVGRNSIDPTSPTFVERLTPAGTPDSTFGSAGTFTVPSPGDATAVTVQSDGHILLGGTLDGSPALWRLTSAGALDSAYATGGVSKLQAPGGPIRSVIAGTDGSVVAVERRPDAALVLRATPSGVLDQSFGDGGVVEISVFGMSSDAAGAVDSNGSITLDGAGGTTGLWTARLHPDGSLDRTFAANGRLDVPPSSGALFLPGWGPTLQTDGKIVIPGIVGSGAASAPTLSLGAARLTGGTGTATPPANTVTRVSGPDRFASAIAISQATFASAGTPDIARADAGAVVLASGQNYPDALVGTPLAASLRAPLLLSHAASLDSSVLTEIQRVLGPSSNGVTVTLLGGTLALSASVEQSVVNAGYAVRRIAGSTRFETAVDVAGILHPTTVLEANGFNFPDAVTAGAAAAHAGGAVLLTNGTSQAPATSSYIASNNVRAVAIGAAAATADPQAMAIVGADRWETSVKVADAFFHTPVAVEMATGGAYPDALAGGARAAELGVPVLLTDPNIFPASLKTYLEHNASWIDAADVFGGQLAISDGVASQVKQAITEP